MMAQVTVGTISVVDRAGKKIAVTTADGTKQTFKLSDHAIEDTGKDSGKGREKGSKVILAPARTRGRWERISSRRCDFQQRPAAHRSKMISIQTEIPSCRRGQLGIYLLPTGVNGSNGRQITLIINRLVYQCPDAILQCGVRPLHQTNPFLVCEGFLILAALES